MYTCPHCGKPAVTALRKAILGPGAPVNCRSCGKPIAVQYAPWLKAALPGTAVMAGAFFVESELLGYGLSAIGLALMILLQVFWVPLAKT